MIEALVIVTVGLLAAVLALLLVLLRRRVAIDFAPLQLRLETLEKAHERTERAIREEIARNREESASQGRALREEVGAALKNVADSTVRSLGEISTAQRNHLEAFASQLAKLIEASQSNAHQLREATSAGLKGFNDSMVKSLGEISTAQRCQLETFAAQMAKLVETNQANASQLREALTAALKGFNDSLLKSMADATAQQGRQLEDFAAQLAKLTETNEKKLEELRAALEAKLGQIQADNAAKLEEMRKTVDEKLQGTLERRLGESFKLVSERLELVHKGLGEMQSLASGVGDLKKVLTNVKTRGTWGEFQLANLLEQLLTPEQYATNVATKHGSNERVEFALKLPGRDEDNGKEVWLPIDAKFPKEDYERLIDAAERADPVAVEEAGKQLELRIRLEAKDIRDKYLDPPHTTDFAILFLPTEGLYAEALRRPGLADGLQRECRVVIAGPTTLAAMLNALQMGFRTLAIQRRSSEVWAVLGAVKTEFGKFGDVIGKVQKKLQEASNVIDDAARRSRTIERKLRTVQELPADKAAALLDEPEPPQLELEEEPPKPQT
jgi:DNA recombination protein RmuC